MTTDQRHSSAPQPQRARLNSNSRSPVFWIIVGSLLVTLVAVLLPRPHTACEANVPAQGSKLPASHPSLASERGSSWRAQLGSGSAQTAEQIVAGKLSQFGHSRREIVRAIATAQSTMCQLLDDFERNYPKQRSDIKAFRATIILSAPPGSK